MTGRIGSKKRRSKEGNGMKRLLIGLSFTITLLVGCSSTEYEQTQAAEVTTVKDNNYETLIKEKLYYIPHEANTSDLAPSFEKFIKENPRLEVYDVELDISDYASNTLV